MEINDKLISQLNEYIYSEYKWTLEDFIDPNGYFSYYYDELEEAVNRAECIKEIFDFFDDIYFVKKKKKRKKLFFYYLGGGNKKSSSEDDEEDPPSPPVTREMKLTLLASSGNIEDEYTLTSQSPSVTFTITSVKDLAENFDITGMNYTWYYSSSPTSSVMTEIGTNESLTIDYETAVSGTYYYFCIVTKAGYSAKKSDTIQIRKISSEPLENLTINSQSLDSSVIKDKEKIYLEFDITKANSSDVLTFSVYKIGYMGTSGGTHISTYDAVSSGNPYSFEIGKKVFDIGENTTYIYVVISGEGYNSVTSNAYSISYINTQELPFTFTIGGVEVPVEDGIVKMTGDMRFYMSEEQTNGGSIEIRKDGVKIAGTKWIGDSLDYTFNYADDVNGLYTVERTNWPASTVGTFTIEKI